MSREEAIKAIKTHCYFANLVPAGKEALDMAIKALEQEPNTWSLDDAREDFMHDVYNTLDFLPTNNEANRIIDSFDRATKCIEQEPCEDTVSRQAVVEFLEHHSLDFDDKRLRMALRVSASLINNPHNIPSVQPNSKTECSCDQIKWERDMAIAQLNELGYGLGEKPETGHWILLDKCANSGYYCSKCHKKVVKEGWSDTVKKIKYCPNCGKRMIELRKSENKE